MWGRGGGIYPVFFVTVSSSKAQLMLSCKEGVQKVLVRPLLPFGTLFLPTAWFCWSKDDIAFQNSSKFLDPCLTECSDVPELSPCSKDAHRSMEEMQTSGKYSCPSTGGEWGSPCSSCLDKAWRVVKDLSKCTIYSWLRNMVYGLKTVETPRKEGG